MVDRIEKSKCTGCKMCADICPRDAITFGTDAEGFWYPKVNAAKCNNCNLCEKKCPSLNIERIKSGDEPDVYAVWSRDIDNRLSSTSGGVFYDIGKYFLEKGGCVAGVCYGDDWRSAKHIIIDDMDGLKRIKGSKYFQGDTAHIYKDVKKKADSGQMVLFCGTPCQNAALQMFLGKEYSNIYYLDFICRSINSPLAFKSYIDELEKKYGSKVKEVQLKNKKYGWQSLASRVVFENGQVSICDKNDDWWVRGFIYNDLYTRESCFQCQYKTIPRKAADITLGDFWAIKNVSKYDLFAGISVVMVNTNKGRKLFEDVKERFFVEERTLEEVKPGNKALFHNPVRTNKQDKFFALLKHKPFSAAVRECIEISSAEKAKRTSGKARRELKRICYFIRRRKVSVWKYIYYNYLCKNVVREGTAKILPFKNAVFDLHPSARIYLRGDRDMVIGINKLKGSKAETHIRMNENSVWRCNHGGELFFNTTLEIKPDALFETGFFTVNGGSVIIADKHIKFGEDVMLGRNIIIYDSDFHQLRDKNNKPVNRPKDVVIEDHVWLTSNITVLKGVRIGRDSLIASQTVISKDLPAHSIITGGGGARVVSDKVNWCRDLYPRELMK